MRQSTLVRTRLSFFLFLSVAISSCPILIASSAAAQQPPQSTGNPNAGAVHSEKQAAATGETKPAESPMILRQLNSAIEDLTARISPAVVQVLVTGYGPLEQNRQAQTALVGRQQAIGSGVIVDSNGYIMTNAHVVEGAQRIHVALPLPMIDYPEQIEPIGKQRILDARLVGMHRDSDLALLKIEATGLPTLTLGSHQPVHQGELVFAIGSPEGLQNSVTMGVVSSVGRQADPNKPMIYIQTDAPINPGNSGGPLLNTEGYVIGINTFILSEGGGSEGLGFAIPARVVDFVYQSLRKYGHVHRIEVKAGAQTITPTLAKGLGLPQNFGVVIDDVTPGGPAAAAGLQVGDIILRADDRPIETLPVFTAALYFHPLDEVLKLEVLRGTERKTLFVPAVEKKDSLDDVGDLLTTPDSLVNRLGVLAVDLNDKIRSMLGDLRSPTGVIVVARVANFGGVDTGLQTGDIIHRVNQQTIDSMATLRTVLRQIKPRDPVVLQIERGAGLQWLAFEME